jgi:hypothetical protein
MELVQRRVEVMADVSDYLSTTVRGQEVEEPLPETEGRLISWKRRECYVKARCVFAKKGWVKRCMTVDELMSAYDIGERDRLVLRASLKTEEEACAFLDVTQQVPTRVLLRCLEDLILFNREDTLVEGNIQQKELGSLLEGKVSSDSISAKGLTGGHASLRALEHKMLASESLQCAPLGVASDQEKCARKNDDAQTQVAEWNRRVCEGIGIEYVATRHDPALDCFRSLLLRRYRSFEHGVIGSFRRYMSMEYGSDWLERVRVLSKKKGGKLESLVRDYEVGIDAIRRASGASFWEWDLGSTVLFWRWPKFLREELRDGLKVWFRQRDLPEYWGRQCWPENKQQRQQLKEKLNKVIVCDYISPGFVKSLTGFFAVPKGTIDIRVVYDATKSGLNAAIWTPSFFLPTATSVLNNSSTDTYFGDIDLGEMFLNYFLDPRLRPRAGVDVTELMEGEVASHAKVTQGPKGRVLMRWDRSLMGVRSSPFNCVRAYLVSEDVIKGNRHSTSNPLRWDKVIFNLPGALDYNPIQPWMFRFDSTRQIMAAFVISYVDDLRTGDQSGKAGGDLVVHHVASRLNYLGEQDAPRKRKEATQRPEAWAGSVIEARQAEGLFVSISQEKWDKVRQILAHYQNIISAWEPGMVEVNYKQLEKDTGFLVHVFMTYENLRPYLKGFYLTLNGWRFDRDDEGWKLGKKDWEAMAEELWDDRGMWKDACDNCKSATEHLGESAAPTMVRVNTRFIHDIKVLNMMFKYERPSSRLIRGFSLARILYGFGDASGAGFGSSWVAGAASGIGTKEGVRYRFGRWRDEGKDTSSNYRELRNLVESLETLGNQGELSGVEVFLFTDNSTAEAAFARGSSSTSSLSDLIKRLKLVEMVFRSRVHVIHVAGKRMVAQGTDGLSRGCLTDGVMRGEEMTAFVPLHQTAIERSEGLLTWFQDCFDPDRKQMLKLLSPEDWFDVGHDITGGTQNCDGLWVPTYNGGNFVWAPPPCVASQCLEELRKARHKRQVSTHVFLCPRIMNHYWQRHLYRSADVIFQIFPGHPLWSKNQYEPLMVGIYFPYLKSEPWHLKDSPKVLGMAGRLQQVLKTDPSSAGPLLRQLWKFTRKLPSMPEQLVLRVLRGSKPAVFSKATSRKRRGASLEKDSGQNKIRRSEKG